MTKQDISRLRDSLRRVFERLGEAKKQVSEAQKVDVDKARACLIEAYDALTSLWHKS